MNAQPYKTNGNTGSTIDSFEVNFNQIEQTNRLLANIETKLNNFFHKSSAPIGSPPRPTSTHNPRTQAYQEQQQPQITTQTSPRQTREDFINDIGNTMLSPIQNKDSVQHFMSGGEDHPLRPINRYINIVDPSHVYTSNHSNTEAESSSNVYMTQSQIINERYMNTDENHPRSPSGVHTSPPMHRYADERGYDHPRTEQYKASNYKERLTTEARNSEESAPEDRVDRGDRRYYEKKIKILEGRLVNSEKEINNLVKLKGSLNSEVIRLRVQLSESQTKFVGDLNKSLRTQEERLRREYEEHHQHRDDYNTDSIKYMEKIDDLAEEKAKVQQELHDLKRQYERVWEEKDRVSEQYNNLLTVHNQMLQMDIQKNEKSLKSSLGERSNDGRGSVAKSQDARISAEQFKLLVESLGVYKQELDALKENNGLIRAQFEEEIETLREELNVQKEQNGKLLDKLRAQTQTLVKLQSPPLQRSGGKDNNGRASTAPMVVTEFSEENFTPNKGVFKHSREKTRLSSQRDADENRTKPTVSSINLATHVYEGALKSNRQYEGSSSTGKKSTSRRREKSNGHEKDDINFKTRSSEKNTGRFNKEEVPFTNAEIKSGMMSREGKGTARELLYRELAELHATPPKALTSREHTQSKSKSRSKSKSQSKRKVSDDEIHRLKGRNRFSHGQKSIGPAYEEFEEELQQLKKAMKSKTGLKKIKEKVKNSKASMDGMDRRKSSERALKSHKSEKRLSTASRPTARHSPSLSRDLRSSGGTARGNAMKKPFY